MSEESVEFGYLRRVQSRMQPDTQRPVVLVAARTSAGAVFRRALAGHTEILEARTMNSAIRTLESTRSPDLVCSTIYFDESRMFDLLRWVRAERPHIPFICARALTKDLAKITIDGPSSAGARAWRSGCRRSATQRVAASLAGNRERGAWARVSDRQPERAAA
jgi:hypothetical protein